MSLFLLVIASHSFAGSATWNANPVSGNWNAAANWTPATVPNGPADVATFDSSTTTDLFFGAKVEVSSIVFNPGASSFNLAIDSERNSANLILSGAGIINNSGVVQNLTLTPPGPLSGGSISFSNAATAGDNVAFALSAGGVNFNDTSSAGSAIFTIEGGTSRLSYGGIIGFWDDSTAANGSFTINGSSAADGYGGQINFFGSAGNAVFTLNPGSGSRRSGGAIEFSSDATAANGFFTLNGSTNLGFAPFIRFTSPGAPTAANATFIVNGAQRSGGVSGGLVTFQAGDAGTATFVANGGNGADAPGGFLDFYDPASASQAMLIANGGINGGVGGGIRFVYGADGGTAQIEVYGNGYLIVSLHHFPGMTIGSLAGDGLAYLGSNNLTIGANNLSTTFSGIIQESGGIAAGTNGSVTKIGAGTLTLSGASTYKGGTTVLAGTFLVKNATGSATGTGTVHVSDGILGGGGIITGATTIGSGAGAGGTLQPGKGSSTATTLTIQNSLTFKSDGTYTWKLNTKKAKADQVLANGVTVSTAAQFDLTTVGNKKLNMGTVFTAISNTAAGRIKGTFANLADGSTVTIGVNKFQVSYSGGDGNDLTLTVVP